MHQSLPALRGTCATVARACWSRASKVLWNQVSTLTVASHEDKESRAARLIGFGRYADWTYAQVAAEDPHYCSWVLKEVGLQSSTSLCDFADYLAAVHGYSHAKIGGVHAESIDTQRVGFGRYRGWTFAQVLAADPVYCAWVLKEAEACPESSASLLDFAAYLRQLRRTVAGCFLSRPCLTFAHENHVNVIAERPTDSATLIRFGKYVGWTYERVVKEDPGYCSWVLRKTGPESSVWLQQFAMYLMPESSEALETTGATSTACSHVDTLQELVWSLRSIVKTMGSRPADTNGLDETFLIFDEISDCFRAPHLVLPFHISQTTWAAAKLQFYDEQLFDKLASAAVLKIGGFDTVKLANTSWGFASLSRSDVELFAALAAATIRNTDRLKEQELANIAWAFAKVGRCDEELFLALAAAAITKIHDFNEQGVANIVWAFAKVGRCDEGLFSALAVAAITNIDNFNEQNIANTAWAFAKVGRYDEELFSALSAAAITKIDNFNEQNVGNTAWAFAKVGRCDKELFSALAAAATATMNEFNGQELAMTAWAFATVGRSDEAIFSALAAAAITKIDGFSEQGVANIAWAFAKVGRCDEELFSALAAAAITKIDDFNEQNVANTAWAFAKVGRCEEELFSALAAASTRKMDRFNGQELANTAWAFAKVGRCDEELFSALAAAAITKIYDFDEQNVANTAWAFAKVGRSDEELFLVLAAAALRILSGNSCLTEHGLCHISWAFVHADLPPVPLVQKLLRAIVEHASMQGWSQVKPDSGPWMSITEGLCAKIVSNLLPHATTSRNRFLLGFELDILVDANGHLTNIEIDGPTHDDSSQRDIDVRRDAFLRRLGVHVVRVDVRGIGSQCAELEHAILVALRSSGLLAQ